MYRHPCLPKATFISRMHYSANFVVERQSQQKILIYQQAPKVECTQIAFSPFVLFPSAYRHLGVPYIREADGSAGRTRSVLDARPKLRNERSSCRSFGRNGNLSRNLSAQYKFLHTQYCICHMQFTILYYCVQKA